jgi:hypothetical protein
MGPRTQAAMLALGAAAAVPGAPIGVEGIPDRALVAYVSAAAEAPCAIDWWDLAAVGAVESGHGTHAGAHIQADGTMSVMAVSYAAARGPMQFIDPTWEHYGEGGDVNDIDDAAPATARMLCANGYERDRLDSFESYNGGGYRGPETAAYAAEVDRFAVAYRQADPRGVPEPSEGRERTPDRLWDRMVARWLTVGSAADKVGAGGVWRSVDDWLFGGGVVASKEMSDASRPDGLAPGFGGRLDRMLADAPGVIEVRSGKRDAAEQKVLYDRYLSGGGALAAWSNGVECASDHCAGFAADLMWEDEATMRWAHDHAADYGLSFDVPGEDWHVSLNDELR